MPEITVNNTTELARYEFSGSTLPSEWSIVQQGSGQTATVASSVLTIAAGTTANAATTLRCNNGFKIRAYVKFIVQLSQRIANQNFYLELTNNAGTTYARIDLNGTSATTAQYVTANQSTSNSAVSATIPTTASYVTFDIYADTNNVFFSALPSNSNSVKSGVAAFDRLVLDPDELYFVQIRAVNGGTAPASNTNLLVDCVVLQDLTSLRVETIRGDGQSALQAAQPVQVVSSTTLAASQSGTWTVQPGNTANTTPWLTTNRNNVFYNESTTAQAASATLTGTSRDVGIAAGTLNPYGSFNAVAFADQAGNLRIEMSNDNTTWRRATPDTAVAANSVVTLSVPVVTRYYRAVYVNGATLQTAFMLNTAFTAS